MGGRTPRQGVEGLLELAGRLRAVFVDMDGTLLLPDSTFPPQTERVIRRLTSTGVRFVPTSGRTLWSLREAFGELAGQIDFVAGNGMDVVMRGMPLRHLTYDPQAIDVLCAAARACPVPVGVALFDEARAYLLDMHVDFMRGRSAVLLDAPVVSEESLPEGPIVKAAVVSLGPAREAAPLLEAPLGGLLELAACGGHWMDALPPGSGKASGARLLLDSMGATVDEAMAFGDSMNDANLLGAIPASVAVGNAMDPVKKLCAFEIGPNSEASVVTTLDLIAQAREANCFR